VIDEGDWTTTLRHGPVIGGGNWNEIHNSQRRGGTTKEGVVLGHSS